MVQKFKYELAFFAAILGFVLFKIPHLSLPLFWDEMGVYGKAVFYLLEHKISIFPGDLDPELSRGHPMLFVFLTSCFMYTFGENIVTGHIFMLLTSISLVISSFYIATRVTNKTIGFLSAIFVLVQPVFNAQSVLILPEVMLGLFLLWSIYFAYSNKKMLYFIFASLAILTKETAIIIPFSVIVAQFIISKKINLKSILIHLSPLLTFITFLFVQKIQNGWFLFPYHTSLIELNLQYILNSCVSMCYFLFVAQGRFVLSLFMIFSIIYLLKVNKNVLKLSQFDIFSVSILIVMIGFSVINFYMTRYFILLFPFIGISIFSIIHKIEFNKKNGLITIGLLAPLFFLQNEKKFNYDSDLGYINVINNLKETLDYLEKHKIEKQTIYCDFPLNMVLNDCNTGYFDKKNTNFTTNNWEGNWDYAIILNPSSYEASIQDTNQVKLVKTYKTKFAESKIYKRK